MNSSQCLTLLALGVASLTMTACADFRRGDYWDDSEGTTGPQPAVTSSAQGEEDSGPGEEESGPSTDTSSPDLGMSGGSTGSDSGGPTPVSFSADVLPLLLAGCERCHSADGQANTTSLILVDDSEIDLMTTLDFVDLESPASSRLLAKSAGQGHTGGVIYDDRSNAYALILAWIEQGANP